MLSLLFLDLARYLNAHLPILTTILAIFFISKIYKELRKRLEYYRIIVKPYCLKTVSASELERNCANFWAASGCLLFLSTARG